MSSDDLSEAINQIAAFLSYAQVEDLNSHAPVDCIVICASAVLYGAEYVFDSIASRPDLVKTLVLCGGIGHSTHLMYDSVKTSARYQSIWDRLDGLPEAQVLDLMLSCHPEVAAMRKGPQVLIEDRSTNCGENASMTWNLCKAHNLTPRSMILLQDPTMARRTIASFEKVFSESNQPPSLYSCPIFVPSVHLEGEEYVFDQSYISNLWTQDRFLELLLGEIPRLRDDISGYGPKGKGFIARVEVPEDVERCWSRLSMSVKRTR